MRLLIALGGNALLKRGEVMSAENQRQNIDLACKTIARIDKSHQIIVGHGNGPQIGLLALQADAYADRVAGWPFDILGAESQGMIGYLLAQSLRNHLPGRAVACLLTQVEVDACDPALREPNKFIGPVYSEAQAKVFAEEKGWIVKPDGKYYRRVVPSPQPKNIIEIETLRLLVDHGVMVIAGGGGGIPVTQSGEAIHGLEAVIDKDRCCSLMASQLDADMLIVATDVDRVFIHYGTRESQGIKTANPHALLSLPFPEGSMRPKIVATCEFAIRTGRPAVIGSLENIADMISGKAGTYISREVEGITYY